MKKLLFILLIGFLSCKKDELPVKTCYVCEVQNYGIRKSVDVCLLPGEQFSFTENGIGLSWKCKLKTN